MNSQRYRVEIARLKKLIGEPLPKDIEFIITGDDTAHVLVDGKEMSYEEFHQRYDTKGHIDFEISVGEWPEDDTENV